jgi:predicted metal-dependent phosphoesterase TrpH
MNNSEVYKKVRDRYKWQGTMTDADVIVKQEEEIEYYRGRVHQLEKDFKESEENCCQMLNSKNETIRELKKALEESNEKVVRPGDTVKFKGNYNLVTFKADNFIVHFSAREEDTVELCGTLIALEKVQSE